MTTDSHTLDRLQMHTGKCAPDSIIRCVCLMCKGLHSVHQGCCQVVTHLRCALLQSWRSCLACMCAALLACQPAKQAPCTCLPVLMPYKQQGATLFAASGCIHLVHLMAQIHWAPQGSTSRCTMFSSTMFSSNRCGLHCVAGACVAAVIAQAPCCTSPSAARHRPAALRLHEQLCELHKPWQRT